MSALKSQFPDFNLEDKVVLGQGNINRNLKEPLEKDRTLKVYFRKRGRNVNELLSS